MATNAREFENGIDLPSTATKLGVDAEGDTHYYSKYHDRLWVNPDGNGIVATIDDVESWIDYVDRRVGWDSLNYSFDGLAGVLVGPGEVRKA